MVGNPPACEDAVTSSKPAHTAGIRPSVWVVGWIREAVEIGQENQGVVNRDEGTAYQLSHIYDNLLLSVAASRGKF